MIVSTPAFLRADNFGEVIVSAVSMIFGFGMGPPDSRLNRKVMPGKNLAVDIVHLFRPNTRRTLRKLSTIVDRGNRVARGRHRAAQTQASSN